MMSRALVQVTPGEVAGLAIQNNDVSITTPSDILVRMQYAPINPADINMIEGRYSLQPTCPCVLGNEGVGIVEEIGDSVEQVSVGDHVIFPFQTVDSFQGMWAERVVMDARYAFVVSNTISLEQASMFSVNPMTALQLLTKFVSLKEGEWLVQNLASSGVGRWVIYCAKKLGLKTFNIVRKTSQIDELKALGADEVVVFEDRLSRRVRDEVGFVRLGLNGVGGASATEVAKCLGDDGVMVTYGAMSKEPISVGNGPFIFRAINLTGFHRTRWVQQTPYDHVCEQYAHLFSWLEKEAMLVPVEHVFSLQDYKQALKKAQESSGKVLFKLS